MGMKLVKKPIPGRITWRIYRGFNGKWQPWLQVTNKDQAWRTWDRLKVQYHDRKWMLVGPVGSKEARSS